MNINLDLITLRCNKYRKDTIKKDICQLPKDTESVAIFFSSTQLSGKLQKQVIPVREINNFIETQREKYSDFTIEAVKPKDYQVPSTAILKTHIKSDKITIITSSIFIQKAINLTRSDHIILWDGYTDYEGEILEQVCYRNNKTLNLTFEKPAWDGLAPEELKESLTTKINKLDAGFYYLKV